METPSLYCQRTHFYWAKWAAAIVALLVTPTLPLHAVQKVTLSWDRNPETDIARYGLYSGTASGNPVYSLDVGSVTNATIAHLIEGTTCFFTVRAVDTVGFESAPSNDASHTAPDPAAHLLTGNDGSGSGNYLVGTIVTGQADPAVPGKQFERWMDDWVILAQSINGDHCGDHTVPGCHDRSGLFGLARVRALCN